MEILKIILLSLGSITTLFMLTKIIGNREMAQLTMFDYINSITIGSIAAEMATSLEDNFLEPLIAMIVYAIIICIISYLTGKSLKLRRFITGKSIVLYENGEIYRDNFKKSKLDITEFLTECRANGYFNLADLQSVILEPNGKLSFLPQSSKRPLNATDMNIQVPSEKPVVNVVLDGVILQNNLKSTGNNEIWLNNEIKNQGIKDIKEIFLATCDVDNNLSIYVKVPKYNKNSIFI